MTEAQKPWEQQYDSGATDEGAEPWNQNYGAPRGLKGWKSGSKSGFDAPKPSALEGVKDSAIALGTGVTQGIGMLANVAGADNAVSRTMADATQALSEYESPYRKAEKQERARKIKEAEESGSTLKEVGAYLGSFAEAPIDTTLNALGTSLPTLAAGFIPGAGQAAVAARVAQVGLGAAQGIGAVKGQIFDEVKQAWKDKGITEEDAAARATQAQSYTGDSAGSIALGGALGAVAGSSGAEASVRRLAGKELAERAAQTSMLKGVGMGALKEAPMEGLQGGQERLASNLVLQNEGFDQGTWTGVAGNAALEATASAPMGAGFGAWEAGSQQRLAQQEQQRRAEIEQSGAGDGELTLADEWNPPNASEGEVPPLEPGMNIDTRGLRISPTNDESAVPFEEVQVEGPSGPGMRIDTSGLSVQDYPGELVGPNPAQREWDTGDLAISDQPQKPSEAMGLRTGPDAGPLENAAALSVDTGATAQMQGAAGIVANDLQSEPQAANAIPVVNFDEVTDPYERAMLQRLYDDHFADGDLESVISANAELDTSFDFGANVNQLLADAGATPQEIEDAQRGQASAQAADRPGQAQENDRGDFDAELSVAKNEGDGSGRLAGAEQGEASQQPLDQQAAAPGSQAEGANVATLAQLNRKKLAEMSDDELQQLSSMLPADHSRQQKIQKAIQDRAAQAQAAINEGVKADGTQTNQAQQGSPQPAQAGAAQAGQQTTPVAASTNAAPNAVEGHAQTAPEFTTIKTIYGDSVTVRTSDLNSDKTRLRQYTRDGKSKAVPAIHRDNLDATGEKGATAASNPLFNTIMDRSGAPFGSRAAAQREVDWLGLSGTHDVVPAGNGFVGKAKTETMQAQQQTAQKEQSATETVAPTAGQQTNSQRNASESAAGQAQAATNNLPANLQEGIAASQEKSKQEQPPPRTQQAVAQPAQAGAAQASKPAGQGLNDGATPAENDGRQASAPTAPQAQAQELDSQQRAKRLDEAGAQWTRMPAAERSALVGRLDGVKPVLAKNMPKAQWESLNSDIQRKLADAMGTTPAQDSGANKPQNQSQQAQAATEGVAQQSPQDFIPAPDGGLDYGEITPDMGRAMRRQAGKIRLQHGVQNADGTGWGLVHIEARHGKEIRSAGFESVEQFLADAFRNVDEVWRPGSTSQLIAVQSGRTGKIAFVQLEADRQGGKDFYRINSAFPANEKYVARKERKEGWKPLWSRYPVPADASGASGFVGQSPEAGETTPTVSGQSGATSVPPTAAAAQPRPKGWEKNYGPTKIVAESLGISLRNSNGKMKKRPELVAEIKAMDAANPSAKNEARQPLTPDSAQNTRFGDVVVDGQGQEYVVAGQRHKWLEVAPFVDGRPQISATTTLKFHLEPETAASYEGERRSDPLYTTGRNYFDELKAKEASVQSENTPEAQAESKAPTEPSPLEHTPKQYADAWLRWSAETNGLPLAEVREMQGDEAGLKAIEQRWVDAVLQEAKSGQPLPAKTLDKLLEVRPNAKLPESAIPDGYQRPEARKAEKEEAAARKAKPAAQSPIERAKAVGIKGLRADMSDETLRQRVKSYLAGERAARLIAAGKQQADLPQYQGVSEKDARTLGALVESHPYSVNTSGEQWVFDARGVTTADALVQGGLLKPDNGNYKHELTPVGKEIARKVLRSPIGDASIGDMLTELEESKPKTGNNGDFDPANPDIRFSFAGQQAATADTMALSTAQQRLEAGEDAEIVRQETGWHKGVDGKWRFEINDADAKIKVEIPSNERLREIHGSWISTTKFMLQYPGTPEALVLRTRASLEQGKINDDSPTLSELIDHPALFSAYPALEDMRVTVDNSMPIGEAAFSPSQNAIILSPMRGGDQMLSALLHEIQHGIQNIEGFATGGGPETAKADVLEGLRTQLYFWANVYGLRREMDAKGITAQEAAAAEAEFTGEAPNADAVQIASDPELQTAVAEQNMQRLEQEIARIRKKGARGVYEAMAGEVEARNTQARQGMTDAQRRATPPSQTADIADNDVIVAFNGKEADSAPAPANAGVRYSRMDDNAATEGVSNEQRQTPNGIPAGLPATSDPDSQYLERRINNWLQTSGWRADRLSAVSLPIELRTALDRFTDATGTRVVLFRNLTPEIEDFNGVNFRDGRVFINETSQHPATLTAAHEWVHNFKRTNPKLYQQLEDEVREQGRIPQWHQRNIKEEGMDRGIDHAIEELTAAAVSDAMTDPAFLEQLALRNQGVFRRVAQAFLDFLDTLTAGWRDQGSNAYLRDVQAFRDKLAQVLDQLPSIGQDAANFATNPARRPGTAQDKAVMQAIADGKSTRDVLRLVANGSKDPFLRQVARLLLKAGITPNIQFGYIGKTKKGDPIHGQYRGESDTIAIAGSAEYAAERIFMHEAMHAATMRALAKPGLPRLQLQKLLEHVRKQPGVTGFYGLKNVDEFVAEVFTNPDFQAALRKMKAPSESSGIKTAWDGFVRILRSILGLKNDPNNALSQALELGVAAMREDMGLRKRADRASLRLRGDVVATAGVTPLQLRVQTVEWAKQRWSEGGGGQAEVVRNTDPRFGKDVRIAWQGVKHAIAGANQPELRLIPHVAKIVQSARYLRSEDDRANRAHIKQAHFFEADVVLDGERLSVGLVVHEKADGQMFYDQFIVSKARDQKDAPPHGTSGNGMPGISDRSVLQPSSGGGSIVGQGMDSGQDGVANFGTDNFAALKASALDQISQSLSHPGKVSLWDKTVGTMRHLAERVPQFKPVFEAAQRFIDDVSMLANDAADFAPRLMPRVESWGDLKKKPITAADNKAVAKPLFEGTLMWARDLDGTPVTTEALNAKYRNTSADEKAQVMLRTGKLDDRVLKMWKGMPIESYEKAVASKFDSTILKHGVVWSQKELKNIFKLSDKQVSLYQEARAAIDRSLDMTARTDMLRLLGDEFAGMRAMVLEQESLKDAFDLVVDTLQEEARANPDMADRLMGINNSVVNRYETATELMEKGYAPLSRFGKYTVDVVDANGERQYFGMFESIREANQMAMKMRDVFKGAAVTQGTMSEQAFKLFQGITPESLEMFGSMLGLKGEGSEAQDKAFQAYLQLAKNNHSALKRLIHRKGIDGYSEDVGRVLASFVYSNARLGSQGLNAGTMETAIEGIPKEMGELRDVAMGLRNYIQDPQEEGQAVRGMLFAQYLGGSVASAFVNMTQPFQITMPWLSQYGGMGQAAKQMARALKDMGTKGFKYEADLAKALQSAEDDGVVSPQEIHQLMAQARGTGSLRTGDGTKLGDARAAAANNWERVKVAWGQPFALAEQFNRRSTFIASYRIAKAQGMADPADFARRAVLETQFLYSKANKMRWGRGAVGGTLMTFKTYSVSYLELMHRMWNQGEPGSPERAAGRRAVGWAVAMLLLMGGAGGLPFMEDAEDLIDGTAQLMGYNLSTKQARKEFLSNVFGKEFAEFMEQGITGLPGMPVDVGGRLGLQNLVPGTGLALEKRDRMRDLLEIAGPAGDLVDRFFTGARKALTGDVAGAALEMSPTAVRNAAKGIDMATSGIYKDTKGYKVMDVTLAEAASKFLGFQPKSVGEDGEASSFKQRTKSFYIQTSADIKAQWADAIFRKDDAALERVRERLAAWNRNNPDLPITVKIPDIMKRVREMGKDREQRINDTAPKALRQQFREMSLEASR